MTPTTPNPHLLALLLLLLRAHLHRVIVALLAAVLEEHCGPNHGVGDVAHKDVVVVAVCRLAHRPASLRVRQHHHAQVVVVVVLASSSSFSFFSSFSSSSW